MNNNDIGDRYQCQPSMVALAGRRRVDLSVTPRSWRQASETSPFLLGMLKACGKWLSICGCGCDPVGHQCTWESLEDSPDTPTFLHRTSVTELANKMKHQNKDKNLDFIFFTYVSQWFFSMFTLTSFVPYLCC